jgi:hypothetical protein
MGSTRVRHGTDVGSHTADTIRSCRHHRRVEASRRSGSASAFGIRPTKERSREASRWRQSRESIWYTAVTGIWQNVCGLRQYPAQHIKDLLIGTDAAAGTISSPFAVVFALRHGARRRARWNERRGPRLRRCRYSRSCCVCRKRSCGRRYSPFLYDLRVTSRQRRGAELCRHPYDRGPARQPPEPIGSSSMESRCSNTVCWTRVGGPTGLYTAPTDEALRTATSR